MLKLDRPPIKEDWGSYSYTVGRRPNGFLGLSLNDRAVFSLSRSPLREIIHRPTDI